SAHDVRIHTTGTKHVHHDVVGDLYLTYETVPLVSEPGLTMTVYAAEPGSASADALALLASWSAEAPRPEGLLGLDA
ncbi:MAG TPA: transcriptional regulator, partial [Propionibacteriaceae bacterium]|nr:transcriptional regulator [Propionibacteriaceae bacterium]